MGQRLIGGRGNMTWLPGAGGVDWPHYGMATQIPRASRGRRGREANRVKGRGVYMWLSSGSKES